MKPLKLILFFAVLVFCIKSYAQENKLFFGLKAGVNYSTVSIEDYNDVINSKLGICSGLNFGYKVHKNILLLLEANYDQKGYKLPMSFTDNVGN